MSETHSLRCPVCLIPFDASEHLPKISPNCDHTLCKECLIQVLKMKAPTCPLDKLIFHKDLHTINAFPTNFLGKELLEMKGKWSPCKFHNKGKKMICLTDKTLVCGDCVIFGEHKGHNIRRLSDFQELVKIKKDQLQKISSKISKTVSELDRSFENEKRNMKMIIKYRFQKLIKEINKVELEVSSKFEKMLLEEKAKLNNIANISLALPFNIENKVKEISDSMLNPKIIIGLVEEDFSDLEKQLDEKITQLKARHTEVISEVTSVFQANLPKKDILKDLNLNKDLDKEIAKFHQRKNFPQRDLKLPNIVIPSAELDIFREAGTLIIWDHPIKKPPLLTRLDIQQITHLQYRLILWKKVIERTIVSALIFLSKHLINVDSIHLAIDCCGKKDRAVAFYCLILTIFSQPEKLKNIEIYASNVILGDIGPLYLFENVLPKIKNLKSFQCTLENTQTTGIVLRAITNINFANMQNLERFWLNLSGALMEEQDIVHFFRTIPNVKDLSLVFGETELTDQALEYFSTRILPSLNKVERLQVGFWITKLTDLGVSKFLQNLPNVRSLSLGLNSLEISDASMQDFLDKKLPSLTNLKELKFNLSGTNISENLRNKIKIRK